MEEPITTQEDSLKEKKTIPPPLSCLERDFHRQSVLHCQCFSHLSVRCFQEFSKNTFQPQYAEKVFFQIIREQVLPNKRANLEFWSTPLRREAYLAFLETFFPLPFCQALVQKTFGQANCLKNQKFNDTIAKEMLQMLEEYEKVHGKVPTTIMEEEEEQDYQIKNISGHAQVQKTKKEGYVRPRRDKKERKNHLGDRKDKKRKHPPKKKDRRQLKKQKMEEPEINPKDEKQWKYFHDQ